MARFTVFLTMCSAAFAQSPVFGPGVSYPAQNMPIAVVTADFNGDGKPDLAVANTGSSSISIFLGNGEGSFTAAPTAAIPGGCAVTGLVAGDFNGDGKADLFAACSFQSTVWVLPGAGTGQFGTPISTNLSDVLIDGFIGTELTNIAVADFNGDGKLDFAAVTTLTLSGSALMANLNIFVGNGNGTFAPSTTLSLPQGVLPNVVLTADFNNDGIPDLAVAANTLVRGSQMAEILFFQGTGKGNFQEVSPIALSGYLLAGAMTVGDVNGDGKPDLVVALATLVTSSSTVTVTATTLTSYLGQGDFTFTPTASESESDQVGTLLVADFQGTGKPGLVEELLDLNIALKHSSGNITPLSQLGMTIRAGNGDGTFQPPTTITLPAGLSPLSIQIAVGDWNSDGLPDLALAASLSSANFGLNLSDAANPVVPTILGAYDAMPAGSLVVMLNTLTPPPAINLSGTQFQFSAAAGGANPPAQSVMLSNRAGGTLTWTAASSASWLSVTPASGTGSATLSVSASIANLSAGPYNGIITISATGASNTPQTIAVTLTLTAPTNVPQITGVVNGASFQPGIESGSWVTIQGTNLSNTNPGRIWTASEIVNGNLPTSLDNTSVTIDGKPAYVYYISPTQLNVQAPTDATTGPVNVVVTNNVQISAPFTAQLQTYSPAFFLYGGTTYAIASLYPNYALIGNPSLISGTSGAAPGSILIFWATGFGPTNPLTPAGIVVTGAPAAATTPVITIGGQRVTILGTDLTPGSAGLYQIAVQLPASLPSGPLQIQATVGEQQSPSGILVYVAGQ